MTSASSRWSSPAATQTGLSRYDREKDSVRRIVETHGGRIWVESPGERMGSVFYFTLPLQSDSGSFAPPSSAAVSTST